MTEERKGTVIESESEFNLLLSIMMNPYYVHQFHLKSYKLGTLHQSLFFVCVILIGFHSMKRVI